MLVYDLTPFKFNVLFQKHGYLHHTATLWYLDTSNGFSYGMCHWAVNHYFAETAFAYVYIAISTIKPICNILCEYVFNFKMQSKCF